MSDRRRLPGTIAEIEAGPAGPEIGVFFDLDGTLIAGYSARYLAEDRIRRREISGSEFVRTFALMVGSPFNRVTFEDIMQIGAEAGRGRAHEDLEEMARVVHQLDHRRTGHRGDLDHVEVLLACHPQRGLGVHHPELLAGGADHPDLGGPDPVVDPGFNADADIPPLGLRPNKNGGARAAPPLDRWCPDDPVGGNAQR